MEMELVDAAVMAVVRRTILDLTMLPLEFRLGGLLVMIAFLACLLGEREHIFWPYIPYVR